MASILLFDGVCNLCNGVVRWIIPRDRHSNIHFASLQSATGQALASQHGIDTSALSTIVLIHDYRAYTASDAALLLCTQLVWPWPWLAPLRIVRDSSAMPCTILWPAIATAGLVNPNVACSPCLPINHVLEK